ncbi:MAG TPA: histidine kinase [Bacteroidia bacterium]|jgi:hypothetical protein|nr:histidine kinase [Bacteroidia bacterium]
MKRIKLNEKIYSQVRNRHLFVWGLILLKFIFFTSITGTVISKVVWYLTLLLNFALAYYSLLLYILPNILSKVEKMAFYCSLLLLSTLLFICIYYFQIEILIPSLGGNLIWTGKAFDFQLKQFIINFSYVLFASLGSYYYWNGINQLENNIKLDKKKVEIEFYLLKNQFHSHFTFNFLNFCYNKIRKFSTKLADQVEDFSEVLRYSLRNLGEKVALDKEIEYLENRIALQKYLTKDLQIEFYYKIEGDAPNIVPRILVIFIEDSFKNAILNDAENPIFISIHYIDSEIKFMLRNKRNDFDKNSDFDVKNIERILNMFYKGKYELILGSKNNIFSYELTISQ